MSTDLHDRRTLSTPSEPEKPDKPSSGLSVAQVVGGALAAMTAAFLGSRLSVAGTVVGAAIASVVAAVGGSVYTSSLRRTHDRVRQVWRGRTAETSTTTVVDATRVAPAAVRAPETAAPHWNLPEQPAGPVRARRVDVKTVVVASVAAFALAAVTLTGIELATGRALSGGQGTTISEVGQGGAPASTEPTTAPSSSPSPSPSASASTPTASSSPTRTTAPVPVPSATASGDATPTPSASPSDTPTATASGAATAAPGVADATG